MSPQAAITLRYDAAWLLAGGSGWAISNNIAPAGVVFDLANVSLTETAGTFSMSGDLALSFEVANFLLGSPADQGRDMGDFSFTGNVVPELSAPVFSLAAAAFMVRRRRK